MVTTAAIQRCQRQPHSRGRRSIARRRESKNRYTGLRTHAISGHRYYAPSTAKWTSRDNLNELGAQQLFYQQRQLDEHTPFAEESIHLESPHVAAPRSAEDIEANPYLFVANNALSHVDRLGHNIYVMRGNNTINPVNNYFHLSVCVDTHFTDCNLNDLTQIRCFSFAATGFGWKRPSRSWLGWRETNLGGPLQGMIYEATYVDGDIEFELQTTRRQDRTWLNYMLTTRLWLEDTYSVGRHNCQRYSLKEFIDAPLNMGPP